MFRGPVLQVFGEHPFQNIDYQLDLLQLQTLFFLRTHYF